MEDESNILFPSIISINDSSDLRSLSLPPTHSLQWSVLQAFPTVEQFISMQGPFLLCHGYLISLKSFWLTGLWEWNLCHHCASLVDVLKDLLWTSCLGLRCFFSCDYRLSNKLMKCFWFLNDIWFDKPGWHRNCHLCKIGLVPTVVSIWARKEK